MTTSHSETCAYCRATGYLSGLVKKVLKPKNRWVLYTVGYLTAALLVFGEHYAALEAAGSYSMGPGSFMAGLFWPIYLAGKFSIGLFT